MRLESVPAFFDEGDEQRAGFLKGAQAVGLAGGGVGVALHGGVGGDDQHVAGFRRVVRGLGAGLDDTEHGNGRHGLLDGVEGEGAGGVAGDDEEVGALFFDQELRALGGVAGDGAAGLGAVGEARGVADESVARLRHAGDEGAQDGESAEAGIEDADGGRFERASVTVGFPRWAWRRRPGRCGSGRRGRRGWGAAGRRPGSGPR